MIANLRNMRWGILLSLITLIFGFGLGGAFGGFGEQIDTYLESQAKSVLKEKYKDDIKNAEKVLDKSSKYFKRAHLHAGGLGTTALALITIIAVFAVNPNIQFLTSLSLGLGSLGYSIYWLIAGLIAPGMGGATEAKEALSLLAIPSAGLCIIGLLAATVIITKELWNQSSASD